MWFNSLSYLYIFLLGAAVSYYLVSILCKKSLVQWWLIALSMLFYVYWNPVYIWLLTASILWNFLAAKFLQTKNVLPVAILGNLALLGYFKYANFFVDSLNTAFDYGWMFHEVILPLAISFFTFQQIAYLVDVHRKQLPPVLFREYVLFVSFFPQLIAGPIVRHHELIPQLRTLKKPQSKDIAIGLTLLGIGLWKKMVMAGAMSAIADPLFAAAHTQDQIGMTGSWLAAVAFGLQIYCDFSGYTDMAIGSAQLFGIRLPENFLSPYKSVTIREFWHRWHRTLSRFLRDYLYIPLGGSKHGQVLTVRNLMITMLLGGLWHGANWTFVWWGAVHGIALIVAYLWQKTRFSLPPPLAWTCTMLSVTSAWILFRSTSLSEAILLYKGMLGLQGAGAPLAFEDITRITGVMFMIVLLPNMQQWLAPMRKEPPDTAPSISLYFRPNFATGLIVGVLALWSVSLIDTVTPFIYFSF